MLKLNGPTNKIIKKQQHQNTTRTIPKKCFHKCCLCLTKVYTLLTLMFGRKKLLMFQFTILNIIQPG